MKKSKAEKGASSAESQVQEKQVIPHLNVDFQAAPIVTQVIPEKTQGTSDDGTQNNYERSVNSSRELNLEEQQLLFNLERKIERSFYEAGKALQEIRDKRLYRATHKNFEEYCLSRFGFEKRHPYRLIEAATIVDNLMCQNRTQNPDDGDEYNRMCPNRTQNQVDDEFNQISPIGRQILPNNEWQVRPLTKLEPAQQVEAWQLSVKEAGGKVPSGRMVKDIVQRIMERTKVANPYHVGEVCQILPKDNPDLRGKGKCWCIVSAVNDFSCTVTTWEKEYTVRVGHLKSLEYLDSDCLSMQQIFERIKKLRSNSKLEEAVIAHLKYLGELKRPYLTLLEEKLLIVLEQESGT